MATSKKTVGTVFIGNKLPNPHELSIGDVKHVLAGANAPVPGGGSILTGEYAITPVPAEFWEAWKTANPRDALLNSDFIFVAKDMSGARSQATDQAEVLTGREPMSSVNFEQGVTPIPRDKNGNVIA